MAREWALFSAIFWALTRGAAGGGLPALVPLEQNDIHGNPEHEVKIYVKVHQSSPFLSCMDLELSQTEIVDPSYLWIGPDGRNIKGQSEMNITETGKLMVKNFQESLSGSYTCTLSYQNIKTEMQTEEEILKTYEFMLFAYREPDYTYQISVRFTTQHCKVAVNGQFFEMLKKILNNLISDLSCQIIDPSYKCHVIEAPSLGLKNELFVTFEVNPFAPGWEVACDQVSVDCEDVTNGKIQQAKDHLEEFFRKQSYVLKHEFHHIPAIHYVDHSFQVIRIDSCRPGFGKNEITHNDCASCCVACDPGTYSPNTDVTCRTCSSAQLYGSKSCQ
ncbi:zona pellucida-binding protein 2 isoform X1 [Tachyglossus aculeatus]|uniref:zona pellucida-binding protein 2 isoform X1 n=1 Tax=Tachyglossus aculeatus TaxID=9261 RepID=UPI0018F74D11|nr:zona pellucida-binding protein 2 isoform X1 [Tachyglossus aculeatus]